MRSAKSAAFLFAVALCCGALLGSVAAGQMETEKKSTVRFEESVQVPGAVLDPGMHVFKLMDGAGNRTIVQIWNEGETRLVATVLAVSAMQTAASGTTERPYTTFSQAAEGSPRAIDTWFHADERRSYQFVYDKSRAEELARMNQREVLASDAAGSSDPATLRDAEIVVIAPDGQERTYTGAGRGEMAADTPRTETAPRTAPAAQTRQTEPTYAQQRAQDDPYARQQDELPETAGELPLLGLVALIALAAAFVLHGVRTRLS